MENKRNQAKNGVALMLQLFDELCETAPKRKMINDGAERLLVNLESGKYEGKAIRLSLEKGRIIQIEFFYDITTAMHSQHSGHDSIFSLGLHLQQTEVTDPILGTLFRESFYLPNRDLSMLIPHLNNLLSVASEFLLSIGTLPCYHIYDSELSETWQQGCDEIWRKTPHREVPIPA